MITMRSIGSKTILRATMTNECEESKRTAKMNIVLFKPLTAVVWEVAVILKKAILLQFDAETGSVISIRSWEREAMASPLLLMMLLGGLVP